MATISKYTTKQGELYFYQIYQGRDSKTGKKKYITKRGFKTQKDAIIAADKKEKELQKGISTVYNFTFKEVYQEWFSTQERVLKPSTVDNYQSLFKNHVLPVMGSWYIKAITKQDAQKFINDMFNVPKNTRLSRSTIQNIKIKTAEVFKYAAKMDYISLNTFEYVIVPREEEDFFALDDEAPARDFWYRDELLDILSCFKNDFDDWVYNLFRLLAFSGARKGEILALQTSDIDFSRKGVKINKTLYFKDKQFHLMKTKNKQTRFVPLDDITLHCLAKYIQSLEEKKKEAVKYNLEFANQNYLFPRDSGMPQRLAAPNDLLTQLFNKHDHIKKLKIHSFRHSYASALFAEGKPTKLIQQLLGHKAINVTMDVYTHIAEYYDPEKEKYTEKMFHYL
ncbi:site-specific integrase [Listeria fleischmannii]|uniref:Integrase n=1 Tax=Listeria fleischmannii FSL S10-1203 TaxID=1265822 RepID=W7DEC3_9LIST|nr:site-specific integrase [Listeria fleischmannii]EUJ53826.1 integrase [Listeria fleischmannii FSL S10-1203]